MRKWVVCLVLATLLTSAAWAEQIYIRNKPFKGEVRGAGAATTVELKALVAALGLTLTELQGNYVVTAAGNTATLPESSSGTGNLYYDGQAIGTVDAGMVPLIPTAQALGAVARINKEMGSIDVNLPVKQISATTPSTPGGSAAPSSGGVKVVHYWANW